MKIDSRTKLDVLLKKYPFLMDFLAELSPRYARLQSPVLRRTLGRVASLNQVAGFGDLPLSELLIKLRAEIKRATGEEIEVDFGPASPAPPVSKEARQEVLKDIIRELHKGGNLEEQKRRFAELIRDVSPSEISEMEQRLIEEGMPEEEVKRLCDVHVQVFKESLDEKPLPSAVPGHPLHTLVEENRALRRILDEFRGLLDRVTPGDGGVTLEKLRDEIQSTLSELAQVEKHYLKKENQLFPLLESKGVSGPSKVMWAIHDDIRMMIREFRGFLVEEKATELVAAGRRLTEMMGDMIYKEEKILFPMSLETLDEKDWARVKKGEEEIGYAWITPGTEWKPPSPPEGLPEIPGYRRPAGIELDTGALTPEQINLLLKNLPVDVTFVDEEVGDQGEGVGDAVGDDGEAEGLGGEGRVFPEDCVAPFLAKVGLAGGGGVGEKLVGGEPLEVLHDGGKVHGVAGGGGDADGGVEAIGLGVGLGALGEDALGEVEPPAEGGKHLVDRTRVPLDDPVQFGCKRMHGALLTRELFRTSQSRHGRYLDMICLLLARISKGSPLTLAAFVHQR